MEAYHTQPRRKKVQLMTVTSGARFAIRMMLDNGELIYRQCRLRQHFVADAITALHLLRLGQIIWVKQDAKLINSIQRSLRV